MIVCSRFSFLRHITQRILCMRGGEHIIMNIKKTLIAGIATATILASVALPAFADNTKEITYVNSPWTCPTGAQPNNNAAGFVNVNLQNGNINGEFSVKGGQVNETYQVYITTQNCGTVEVVGTLTTNGQGNGNVTLLCHKLQVQRRMTCM